MFNLKTFTKSVFSVYASYALLVILLTGWSMYTGEYQADMSRAVDYAAESMPVQDHNEMLIGFIAISVAVGIAFLFITSILAWFTNKAKKWARWPFLAICVWQAFDSIYSMFDLNEMYPGMIETSDWVSGVLFCLIWLYLLYLAWLKSPNKNSLCDAKDARQL